MFPPSLPPPAARSLEDSRKGWFFGLLVYDGSRTVKVLGGQGAGHTNKPKKQNVPTLSPSPRGPKPRGLQKSVRPLGLEGQGGRVTLCLLAEKGSRCLRGSAGLCLLAFLGRLSHGAVWCLPVSFGMVSLSWLKGGFDATCLPPGSQHFTLLCGSTVTIIF